MPWQTGVLPTLPIDKVTGRPIMETPPEGWPRYPLSEVAKHNQLKDAWIVVHNRVYDITTFAVTHPGFNNAGQVSTALAIHRTLGTDCTQEYTEIHSPRAWRELADFQIGVCASDEEKGDLPPAEHPLPTWLSASRDFWVKYAGGADKKVVEYCEQMRQKHAAQGEELANTKVQDVEERHRRKCVIV